MPYYEFNCPVCGVFAKRMKMCESEIKERKCDCGETATKVPSLSIFELKGGGWYDSGYSKGD